jgi:polysaccharide export outer membrane protein
MRPSVINRGSNLAFFMLLFTLLATAPSAWAENQGPPVPTTPKTQAEPAATPAAVADGTVRQPSRPPSVPAIGGGDLLKVAVLGAPDADQDVRVNADGNISLNLVGSVHVAGLTAEQAQIEIAKRMVAGGFFTEPQVSVFIKEYATQGVSVMGEVSKPGVYPVLGTRSLFDVLSLAGGLTSKAGQIITITHRDHPQTPNNVLVTNNTAQSIQSNVEVFPGDTVVVSKAGIVYVVGDVHRPSGVVMENGNQMTVLQAIAMAEGTNPTAALNSAKIIRKTPDGPKELPLELKKILAAKSPDITLQAEDIIFVPGSAAKGAAKRGMEAIIQVATGLAVYRPY